MSLRDPYQGFVFRVKCDGSYVAGVSKVSGLMRPAGMAGRAGGDPDEGGPLSVTLERGVTDDARFVRWAGQLWSEPDAADAGGPPISVVGFHKDLTIEANNEAGQRVLAWRLDQCWPEEFRAHMDPDGGDETTVIESLTLWCEGIERDASVGAED
ncbi:MAG: phage tail protein [Myxococcales bacterium]|nr:phage tail protein [Myxococcales bacterium]